MVVDFDAIDTPPVNEQQMSSYKGYTRVMLWDRISYSPAPSDLNKLPQRYVLGTLPPANADVRMYNVGNLLVSIFGSSLTAGTLIGQLFVDYEVELLTPQLSYDSSGSTLVGGTVAKIADKPFLGPLTITPAVGNPITVIDDNTFYFNEVGRYLIEGAQIFSGAAASAGAAQPFTSLVSSGLSAVFSALENFTSGTVGSQYSFFRTIADVSRAGAAFPILYTLTSMGSGLVQPGNNLRITHYPRGN